MYEIISQIDYSKFDEIFAFSKTDTHTKIQNRNCKLSTVNNVISPLTIVAPAWNALSLTTNTAATINNYKDVLNRDPNLLVNKIDCDA